MPVPLVSVIVPARDAASTLPATLGALAAQGLAGAFEVLVVDDASTDATAALAAAHPAVGRVLAGRGAGPGAARNLAVAVAAAPVLAFTDADCRPEPGWLRAGLAALEHADLVQGRVVPDGPCGPWDRTIRVDGLTGLWETANLLARTDAVRAVGGFAPGLRPRRSKELGEDVGLGWELQRAGARVAYAPDAVVRHAVIGRGAAGYVAERARLRFVPGLVRRSPELRTAALWRRRFLTERQARFDLAVAGLAGAVAARRGGAGRLAYAAGLALAAPYLRQAMQTVAGHGPRRTAWHLAVGLAADTVGAVALAAGSLRAGRLVA